MPLSPEHIRENPWWADPSAIESDPHLRRLATQPLVYEQEIPFELDEDAVFTLRGPRQVGKTTLLKGIISHLIRSGVEPRDVLYSDITGVGISSYSGLQRYLKEFIDSARSRENHRRLYILLDEVTGVDDWGVAIRTLHGRGALDDVTAIATGSHALDIKRGGERAPGRRGAVEHWDWLMMPLAFRQFVELHDRDLYARLPVLESFEPAHVYETGVEAHFLGDRLQGLFERYLMTGGFPYAIAAEYEEGVIPERIYRLYRDAIRGEVARAGLNEQYFRELISWAGHKRLGQEFSWTSVSSDTTIGSKNTARNYLEVAENLFLWHIYYRILDYEKSRVALKSPKKLYPADPFAWHVLVSWARGEKDGWKATIGRLADPTQKSDLIESICADHFRRRFNDFAFYYRSPKGRREIDFVLFDEGRRQSLIEVKYQRRIRRKHRSALAEAGGGCLATADHLEWYEDDNVAALPTAYLLAALPWQISLFPEIF